MLSFNIRPIGQGAKAGEGPNPPPPTQPDGAPPPPPHPPPTPPPPIIQGRAPALTTLAPAAVAVAAGGDGTPTPAPGPLRNRPRGPRMRSPLSRPWRCPGRQRRSGAGAETRTRSGTPPASGTPRGTTARGSAPTRSLAGTAT